MLLQQYDKYNEDRICTDYCLTSSERILSIMQKSKMLGFGLEVPRSKWRPVNNHEYPQDGYIACWPSLFFAFP